MERINLWGVLSIYAIIIWCQVDQVSGNCRDANAIFTKYSSTDIPENSTNLFFPDIFVEEEIWDFEIKEFNNLRPTPTQSQFIKGYFVFNATKNSTLYLGLTNPLDKEYFYFKLNVDTDSILLSLTCRGEITPSYDYRIRITAVNEYPAKFQHPPFNISIPEDTPIGTSVFNLNDRTKDTDVPEDRPFTFSIVKHNIPDLDGNAFFRIPSPTQGVVELSQVIDFDEIYADQTSLTYRILNVTVKDTGNKGDTNILIINITDVDDQPPAFNYPGCVVTSSCGSAVYKSYTHSSYRGLLVTEPEYINARDQDSFNYSLKYSFLTVSDNPSSFVIDPDTGKVSQVGDIFQTIAIQIKAEEISTNGHYAVASLIIYAGNETDIKPVKPKPALGNAGASTAADDSSDFKTIVVIVAVLALVVITVLIVAFLVYHRKQKKAVSPGDSEPSETSTETDTGEIQSTKSMQWPPIKSDSKVDLLAASTTVATLPTPDEKGNKLPPLELKDSSTETEIVTKKKRSRRRNKNKEPEIFDGTKEYEMEADPEFFDSTDKSKIKRSSRSKDTKTDPKYWITVQNDF